MASDPHFHLNALVGLNCRQPALNEASANRAIVNFINTGCSNTTQYLGRAVAHQLSAVGPKAAADGNTGPVQPCVRSREPRTPSAVAS